MLFNSLDFFVFLPIVVGGFFVLPHARRNLWLIAASLFFYMYWNIPYVGLLLLSAGVDYRVARALDATADKGRRKLLLAVSLCTNLGLLALFKYYNFFVGSLTDLGLPDRFVLYSELLLPLGISFYTFQTMSYTIDVYRRQIRAETRFTEVLLYVSFFPQLVAGPIERASSLIPQLKVTQQFDLNNVVAGARRILAGMVKKVVIADNVAALVDPVYADPGAYSGAAMLLATYGFAVQIFCDFSGYSDIAIGTARMMGFRFMENFDSPYRSQSIREFWRRWHISLSTWLRDYLYISLGGSRGGSLRTYRNLLITMLLGGLWHGASYNFVIWGALHGGWLAAERALSPRLPALPLPATMARALRTVAVFHGVCLTWVFFRAQTLSDALTIVGGILTLTGGSFLDVVDLGMGLLAFVAGVTFFALPTSRAGRARWLPGVWGAVAIVLFGASSSEFIYFIF